MVPEIDFLPASYHQVRQRQQKNVWRSGVVAMFLVLATLSWWQQGRQHGRLAGRRDELNAQYQLMQAQLGTNADLRKQVDEMQLRANLVARLQVRVPPTRILASLVESLPEFVSLDEIKLTRSQVQRRNHRRDSSREPNGQLPDNSTQSAEAIDLHELDQADRNNAIVASIVGLAPDDMAVSNFMKRLDQTNIFEDVQLMYSDKYAVGPEVIRKFSIRLTVRQFENLMRDHMSESPQVVATSELNRRTRRY